MPLFQEPHPADIQYENRYPDELAVPHLESGMFEMLHTRNGNLLHVAVDYRSVDIVDPRALLPDSTLAMYTFRATNTRCGTLHALIRSRDPFQLQRKHPDIRPQEQLKQAIDFFDTNGQAVTVFRAEWERNNPLRNTNALVFARYVENPDNHYMDPLELRHAALLQTPTGKMMTNLGFAPDFDSFYEQDYEGIIGVDFIRN